MKYMLTGQETDRLLFRPIVPEDFEAWLPFYHNPDSTRFWNTIPENPRIACKRQFDRIFERYEADIGGMNALVLKQTKELVGICGLLVQVVDEIQELEIGYSVLPRFWRKGYAHEAAEKCKRYAFEKNYSHSLISIIHVDNIPSQKVALKNGMALDKTTTYKDNPVHIYRINTSSI